MRGATCDSLRWSLILLSSSMFRMLASTDGGGGGELKKYLSRSII